MKLVELVNLSRKDNLILYRREYSAEAVFETPSKQRVNKRIEFILEHSALGSKQVQVSLLEDINYPLVNTLASLKTCIMEMDEKGQLPN